MKPIVLRTPCVAALLCCLLLPLSAAAEQGVTPAIASPAATAVAPTSSPAPLPGHAQTADAQAGAVAEADAAEDSALADDLSPWGMYQNADVVVQSVMIGLLLASMLTWTIWLAKSIELLQARRRLRRELPDLKGARNLAQAAQQARAKHSFSTLLIEDARD